MTVLSDRNERAWRCTSRDPSFLFVGAAVHQLARREKKNNNECYTLLFMTHAPWRSTACTVMILQVESNCLPSDMEVIPPAG